MPVALGVLLFGAAALALAAVADKAAGGTAPAPARSSSSATPPATGQVTGADLQAAGARHGWTGAELTDWAKLIAKESSGNPRIVNPSSGAAGIAQFIDGFGAYSRYGGDAGTVPGQLTAMANYIKQRYVTPSAAWAHEQANNWY